MSQFNLRYVPTLSCNEFLLNGQRFNTQGAVIANTMTSALTTEVIINDDTKNQVLFQEIAGNIHGNLFPQVQAEIDALEANVSILQGNVVSLQSQINVLTGNIIFDEFEIAALFANTQFLEAPHNGLAGNTSFFWRGLQVYNTPTDAIDETNGTGIFSYLDNAGPANQIQFRAQDSRFISLKGSTSITAPSGGNVVISGNSAPMFFSVGNPNLNNVEIGMNGNINLKGEGVSRVSIYTKSQLLPVPSTTKTVDIVGADEANILGKKITATSNDGGQLQLTGSATLSGSSVFCTAANNGSVSMTGGTAFLNGKNGVSISADNGKTIDIQCSSGSSNSSINIGTAQGALDTGFCEISLGQSGPPAAIRKSSTFIHGDMYMDYGGLVPPNTGLWDLLLYQGLPTIFSGPTNAPVKTTVNPYFRSISTFCPDYTNNSFFQSSGTFSVLVGAGGIIMNTGIGGFSLSCLGGAVGITALVGGVLMTTAAGAIQMTTGAGAINMTTGAAPIQMETNIGDVLIKAGYAFDSTPQLSLGSIYLQARDYTYITPDKNVVVGAGIEPPFNEVIANTLSNSFFGNLFTTQGPIIGNVVFSNVFTTPNIKSSVVNPLIANLYYQGNIIGETGRAQATLFYANGTLYTLSDIATVPYYGIINANGNIKGNIETTKFTFNFTDLPLNANMFYQIDPVDFDANITTDRYAYGTWQSNAQIQSNISILLNAFLEPPAPTFDRYLTVLGNASFQSDVECNSNIIVQKDAFPLLKTEITNNSIFTSGNITCQTLNYTTLNPPIVSGGGGVDSIIAGTNVNISPLNGKGNVVINCTLPNVAGVSRVIAGNGIQVSPVGGTGDVTVAISGSLIPPGGYLPIAGGTMTGPIYQFPSSNINDNTVKKYRPLTSYQPPFPSIGPPSFTGEMLTFFNGDNSPEQSQFTGWFPQNMFQYEPDVITQAISGVVSNFYSSTGGTTLSATDIPTAISNFTVGQRITGGSMVVNGSQPGYRGVIFYIYTAPPNEGDRTKWNLLYQTNLKNFPTTASTYSLSDIDYTYDGSIGQLGQNWMVVYTDYEQTTNFISLNTVNTNIGDLSTYAWDGNIANFVNPDEFFIGVQGDPTTSVLYEYFSTTNLTNKLLAVTKATGVAKIHGIYSDDTVATRQIIVYGDFENVVQGSNTIVVNNIFQYNINTNTVIQLTTQTTDPAYAGNLPKGVNGAVYGVEKQVSSTASRRVWIWGDMTGVAQMGNPAQPTDCTLKGGCNCTLSDNWPIAISWDFAYAAGQGPFNCRGGRIINNVNPGSNPDPFLLLLYCGGRFTNTTFNSLSMIYYNVQIDPGFLTSPFPFQNGSITSAFSNPVDYIYLIDNQIIMTGDFTGTARGASATDVPIYSIMRAPLGTFDNPSGQYSTLLFEMANSSNAGFWLEGTDQIGVSRIKLMNGGETLVLGTDGYGTPTLGGGVLTFNFLDITFVDTLAVKFTLVGVPPYTVLNIANDMPTAVLLSCNLNEDNFFFGQTFDASFVPQPPTIPTVNAINGAVFAVGHFEMTKIVFSSGNEDYNSVSFIAGDVEAGDKSWYWQAQVGAIDYFAGNTFFPNITAIGTNPVPTSDTLGSVMINGAIASTNLNMNNFDITNANTIYSANILTLNPINGVEVGVGQRRQQLVVVEVQNTGALTGQNNFDMITGILNVGAIPTITIPTQITDIIFSSGYDDGSNGNSTISVAFIENDGGTETVLGSGNRDTGIGLNTQTITFSPPISITPNPAKYYFVRMSVPVPPSGPMYSYYGTMSDGLTAAIIVNGTQLQQVSDPVEYFNVYGNCFFQENVLVHANITVANPTNEFFKTVIEYNYIDLIGETNNTQMGPGSTYITSGVNQQIQQATSLQLRRTDIVQNATLTQTQLQFFQQFQGLTTTVSTTQINISSTGNTLPISNGLLGLGIINLNHNTDGAIIRMDKNSVSAPGTVVSKISSFSRDSASTSFEFSRIQTAVENNTGGNQDGRLSIFNLVNGVLQETWNFNGGQNENNSFRPLDLNNNPLRTTLGNLEINTVASTGPGLLNLITKGLTGNISLNAGGLTGNAAITLNTTNLNFQNTATTTAVQNHTSSLATTSNIPDITHYLRCKLNGADIWIPYFTQDPGV
jgi:hypothetical protein